MSTSYLDGHTFNVSALVVSHWTRHESVNLPSPNAQSPSDCDDVPQLVANLAAVQKKPSTWTHLSRWECVDAYNKAEYSKYGTLIVVTDYTTPDSNNSALAVGVLPGYRLSTRSSSLLALCPDAYLAAYQGSRKPTEAPLINTDGALNQDSSKNPGMLYIDPDEAEKQAQANITNGFADMPWELGHTISDTGATYQKTPNNVLTDIDLCYDYWDIRWNRQR